MIRSLLLPAACCLLPALPLFAQDTRSHIPVPRTGDADPTQLFRDRIQQSKSRAELDGMLRQLGSERGFGNPEQMRKLLETNPQLQDMARKMAADLASADPEKKERLRDLIGSVLQSNPELQRRYRLTPDDVEKQLRTMAGDKPSTDAAATRPTRPTQERPRAKDRPATPPKADTADMAARRQWTKRIAEWAEKFPRDKLSGSFRDSPAIKDLFRRLTDSAADAMRSTSGGEGLDAQLARWESWWNSAHEWLPSELPAALQSWRLPELSNIPQPDWHMADIDMRPPVLSGPRLSVSGVDPGMAANVVFALIAVGITAVLVWRLRGASLAADAAGRRPLGPWPLDPARVASRAELIRAFEYLSLLRYGEPARAWNHRAIAERLGGSVDARRDAAEQLAALYEQARYTPMTGGEPDWTAARGPLLTLAGAG
jgi:hypothetical protein